MLSVTRTFLLSAIALATLAACQPKEEAKEASSTPAASAAPAASGESTAKAQAREMPICAKKTLAAILH